MKNYIFTFIILLSSFSAFGQGVRSADIHFGFFGSLPKKVTIVITTITEDYRPEIVIDWGDGTIGTTSGNSTPGGDLFYNNYTTQHTYQDTGIYEIIYRDSFWVGNIDNIPNSGQQPFVLKAKAWLSSESGFSYNRSVWLVSSLDMINQLDDGKIVHNPVPNDLDFDDTIQQRLIPVPVPGYFFPGATDSIACCFIWDKPVETGRYAFGMEYEDWRQGRWMGTIQRFITIDVDSLPTTNSYEQLFSEIKLMLSPNPAHTTLHITATLPPGGPANPALTARNLLGQLLLRQELPAAGGVVRETVDVSGWPPGVYFITLEAGWQVVTERVVVQ